MHKYKTIFRETSHWDQIGSNFQMAIKKFHAFKITNPIPKSDWEVKRLDNKYLFPMWRKHRFCLAQLASYLDVKLQYKETINRDNGEVIKIFNIIGEKNHIELAIHIFEVFYYNLYKMYRVKKIISSPEVKKILGYINLCIFKLLDVAKDESRLQNYVINVCKYKKKRYNSFELQYQHLVSKRFITDMMLN